MHRGRSSRMAELAEAGRWRSCVNDHPQVHIEFEDMSADVDEGIADVILACWKRDITTTQSCQENRPGIAWVSFYTATDAERFVSLVALYGRGPDRWNPRTWHWDTYVGPRPGAPSQPHFFISVRFPHADLPTVRDRLGVS
jgi:hypothetical protein